mmetsp:Transcript_10531/g.7868  ORF Transcript_10531/g.7868 Transcript_10531/m.7868 type:complete len:83 (+) Transcript_10531:46-294(+)
MTPLMRTSELILSELDTKQLQQLHALNEPSPDQEKVFAAIFVLIQKDYTCWPSAQSLLKTPIKFIDSLKVVDVTKVSQSQRD